MVSSGGQAAHAEILRIIQVTIVGVTAVYAIDVPGVAGQDGLQSRSETKPQVED
jgi:hypothetical protein